MSPVKCALGQHEFAPLNTRLKDEPTGAIQGMMLVCRACGAQKPAWGLLRKGAKLFNDKQQWIATVEKAAVK
jgi:hypothetical protein